MNEKALLLQQLRLDRSEAAQPAATDRRVWWAAGGLAVSAFALGAAYLFFRTTPGAAAAPVAVAAETVSGTTTASAARRSAAVVDASGYVVPARQATVSAKTVGRLIEVLVEEGQAVSANEIVARVDDSNTRAALEEAQARLVQAEVTRDTAAIALEDAQKIFRREQLQRAAKVISAQDFDNARSQYHAVQSEYAVKERLVEVSRAARQVAQRNQDDTVMRAPFAGRVTVKTAQVGETVSPMAAGGGFTRTGICTIVDMDSLGVEVDISEKSINRVHAGQRATVKLNAYPDWEIPAEVTAIVPVADRSKATVKVRVGLKVNDPRILPEGSARVAFLGDVAGTAAPAGRVGHNLESPRAVYAKDPRVANDLRVTIPN
jgi:RND family efflux transporter MFP subunit